jgi:hypothetical protein
MELEVNCCGTHAAKGNKESAYDFKPCLQQQQLEPQQLEQQEATAHLM